MTIADEIKKTSEGSKLSKKTKAVARIPAALLTIDFLDRNRWLEAYAKHPREMILRAVLISFRLRYLLSVASAARKCGVTTKSWFDWERGKTDMRFETKLNFVESGWLLPFHFGINIEEGQFQT